jgi:RNA polymerase sigma-70 factor, ECF subfamily
MERAPAPGDESAWAVLYSRLAGAIYRFALRMSGSPAVAEDVTQETFMVLIEQPRRFDPRRGSLLSFLYGVARNQVLRRSERERPFVPLDLPQADGAADPADTLQGLLRRERIDMTWRALLDLPPHYREVIVLCEFEHMSYDEVAGLLDCPVGTVRSRLHRGRARLAEKLQARGELQR